MFRRMINVAWCMDCTIVCEKCSVEKRSCVGFHVWTENFDRDGWYCSECVGSMDIIYNYYSVVDTLYGTITYNDLESARMLAPNRAPRLTKI